MRLILAGLGNVGRSVLTILAGKAASLERRLGAPVRVVGAVDSSGAAADPNGLDPERLLAAKRDGSGAGALGWRGASGLDLLDRVEADALLEATPVDLVRGEPGLGLIRAALERGIHCVVANKAPIALAYQELAARSDLVDPELPALRFSACVGGALPTVNLGRRDLAGAEIVGIESVLNGTCQGILRAMEEGRDFGEALAEMQRRGVAESDPSLDVDGWDQAVKLVILANAVLGRPAVLADVAVSGIRGVSREQLVAARDRGQRVVLLGRAERPDPSADWRLTVGPVPLPAAHPLARMGPDEMGIVYRTDVSGTIHATSEEADAMPTAAAMIRDLIDLAARPAPRPTA
jgi:homoserine dehydrogenase